MKKRAGFARALVLEPEIVMFDEPDSGLDPVRTALLCRLIQQVHAENGGTYIVITHDIASARRIGEYRAAGRDRPGQSQRTVKPFADFMDQREGRPATGVAAGARRHGD